MKEKEGVKKLIVLLVVIVALSLVVDLLSLNVLYSVKKSGGLMGELDTRTYTPCEQGVNDKYRPLVADLWEDLNKARNELSSLQNIKDQNCDAVYEDLKNSGYCIDRASIEWDLAYAKKDLEDASKKYSNAVLAWTAGLLQCRAGSY